MKDRYVYAVYGKETDVYIRLSWNRPMPWYNSEAKLRSVLRQKRNRNYYANTRYVIHKIKLEIDSIIEI